MGDRQPHRVLLHLRFGGHPLATIGSNSGSLDAPGGVALDVQGDLWVANADNDTVVEYTPSQLAATGHPTPSTITATTGTGALDGPWQVSFDAHGDLWVVTRGDGTLLEYAHGNLGGGNQAPAQTITPSSLSTPQGAAVDPAGNLWVANAGTNAFTQFTPAALTAGGSPQASSTISSSALSDPTGIALAEAPVVSSLTQRPVGAGTEVTITPPPRPSRSGGGARSRSPAPATRWRPPSAAPSA